MDNVILRTVLTLLSMSISLLAEDPERLAGVSYYVVFPDAKTFLAGDRLGSSMPSILLGLLHSPLIASSRFDVSCTKLPDIVPRQPKITPARTNPG